MLDENFVDGREWKPSLHILLFSVDLKGKESIQWVPWWIVCFCVPARECVLGRSGPGLLFYICVVIQMWEAWGRTDKVQNDLDAGGNSRT